MRGLTEWVDRGHSVQPRYAISDISSALSAAAIQCYSPTPVACIKIDIISTFMTDSFTTFSIFDFE
jgi:hypothetical protein